MNSECIEKNDYELITAYLKGDEKSFETLYFRYRKLLYGYLNNLMPGDSAGADEVFAECWTKVISKLSGYRDDGKFSAWLFRLAHNLFIDHIRRNRNKVFRSLDSEEAPDLPAPDHREPGKELENIELGREIQNAVQSLSQEQREVFLLRQQELSFKEIAEIQKCSLNTVLSRMHYAIKNLRVFLTNSRSLIK